MKPRSMRLWTLLFLLLSLGGQACAQPLELQAKVVGKPFPGPDVGERFLFDGCADCFGPFRMSADEELQTSEQASYSVSNLIDNDFGTCWAVPGGIGSWFSLRHRRAQDDFWPVDGFHLINGYTKSMERWRQNSRIRELEIRIDHRVYGYVLLQDTPRIQAVRFPQRLDVRADSLRFTVVSVYPGSYYDDLCVSEFQLDGGH